MAIVEYPQRITALIHEASQLFLQEKLGSNSQFANNLYTYTTITRYMYKKGAPDIRTNI